MRDTSPNPWRHYVRGKSKKIPHHEDGGWGLRRSASSNAALLGFVGFLKNRSLREHDSANCVPKGPILNVPAPFDAKIRAVIRTEGISKEFSDAKRGVVHAVEDVDLIAYEGEVFGLLGVNGAGKTTLLRMLSTIIKPTRGTAEIGGHSILTDPESVRANIGFLSTSTALYTRLTGVETLEYFGGLYGLTGSRLKERVDFAMEKLKLHEFKDRLCDKLSTGQKQRVSIARTILHDPPVLFFDEPTAGLDVVTSQTIMEFIEEVRDLGKTVVFSTHIMSEAERLCNRIAVIHEGKICGAGTVDELKERTGESTMEKAFLKTVGYSPQAQPA